MSKTEEEILNTLGFLSSDELRNIWKACTDILSARRDYLWKVSTDGEQEQS